jgi:hypothetical protein
MSQKKSLAKANGTRMARTRGSPPVAIAPSAARRSRATRAAERAAPPVGKKPTGQKSGGGSPRKKPTARASAVRPSKSRAASASALASSHPRRRYSRPTTTSPTQPTLTSHPIPDQGPMLPGISEESLSQSNVSRGYRVPTSGQCALCAAPLSPSRRERTTDSASYCSHHCRATMSNIRRRGVRKSAMMIRAQMMIRSRRGEAVEIPPLPRLRHAPIAL